jgi:hypothetical protein
MDNTTLYRVTFDGKVREGEDPAQVKARLSALFKTDIAAIDKVFRDSPTYIQRNLTEEKALKYKTAFERTGALCRIEAEPVKTAPEPQAPPPPPAPGPVPPPPPPPQTAYTPTAADTAPQVKAFDGIYRLDREAWKSLAIGGVIAVVVLSFSFLSFVFRYMITLVHEIGHAIFGWLFGYPSIPAFDFTYGGGITLHQDRRMIIVIIVYVLFALLFYLYRRNHLTLLLLIAITAFYSLSALTSLHNIIVLFMGHGMELIFGGIFFYRALSGSSVIVNAERPLYAFLGIFVFFTVTRFAHRLMTSSSFRADYEAAKGGGHWMDFSRIAEEFFNTKLSSVAALFLLLCLLAPIITFLFFRYKEYIFNFFNMVLATEPKKGTGQ